MRALGRWLGPTLSAVAIVTLLGGATAAASPQITVVHFKYNIMGLPSGQNQFQINYDPSRNAPMAATVTFQSEPIDGLSFQPQSLTLYPVPNGPPVSVTVEQDFMVQTPTLSGSAQFPSGTRATLTNFQTGTTITLSNGRFSIPTGVGGLGAKPPKASTQTIRCNGNARRCKVTVSLAGGASNRKLIIRLTDTNLHLQLVQAFPRSSRGAYLLSGGRFALGGSEYIVTLNAVKSNPKGAHLVLTFAGGT